MTNSKGDCENVKLASHVENISLYSDLFDDVQNDIASGKYIDAKDHYDNLGRIQIEAGHRSVIHTETQIEILNSVASIILVLKRTSAKDTSPARFLHPDDQGTIDAVGSFVFEYLYLKQFRDVEAAVLNQRVRSGFDHWLSYGREQLERGLRRFSPMLEVEATQTGIPIDIVDRNAIKIISAISNTDDLLKLCVSADTTSIQGTGKFASSSKQLKYPEMPQEGRTTVTLANPSLIEGAKIARGAVDVFDCDPKIIAFYLPQYHRVIENDLWWGEGFTEWTNVRKAQPNFIGHKQPHVPFAHDYYDLTDPDVQKKQSSLAKEYGITAFCYYMYWFDGRRILEKPLDQVLENSDIDIEFCVCWANENWTRTWDGKSQDVLIGQEHTLDSDKRFIRDAIKYFKDPRYLRVDGKLVLLVYRVDLLQDSRKTADLWRDEVLRAGLGEIHLCAVQFYGIQDPRDWGFDAAVEFPPHGWLVQENLPDVPPTLLNENFTGNVFEYSKAVDWALTKTYPPYTWYRGVFPGWDNTARRQDTGHTFANSDASQFERWLTEVLRQTIIMQPVQNQLVFVNAWNEWGEGAHLEPDEATGRLNLMALNSALNAAKKHAWPLSLLKRLREPGDYEGRQNDERSLLSLLRSYERGNAALMNKLRSGV